MEPLCENCSEKGQNLFSHIQPLLASYMNIDEEAGFHHVINIHVMYEQLTSPAWCPCKMHNC